MEKQRLVQRTKKLFYLILIGLTGCASTSDHQYFIYRLGLNVEIKGKIFDSSDAINPKGEGFSIRIYNYENNKNKDIFINKATYPKTYKERKNWKILQWQNAPLLNNDVLGLLFKYDIDNVGMKEELSRIKEVLNSPENYFCYYYKDYDGEIYAVNIYIVDIKNKKIIFCEIIT